LCTFLLDRELAHRVFRTSARWIPDSLSEDMVRGEGDYKSAYESSTSHLIPDFCFSGFVPDFWMRISVLLLYLYIVLFLFPGFVPDFWMRVSVLLLYLSIHATCM